MDHIKLGNDGEQAAAALLERIGYKVLVRKYRTKTGEIDIIAMHRDTIVFVEVKTRRNTAYGFPAEAVTYRKQRKIINTALCYLNQVDKQHIPCRFDVVEVLISPQGYYKFNHITDAFSR